MHAYSLFRNPVSHSKSLQIHALFAQLMQQLMAYGLRFVPPVRFRRKSAK